jgi:hypothetical protein
LQPKNQIQHQRQIAIDRHYRPRELPRGFLPRRLPCFSYSSALSYSDSAFATHTPFRTLAPDRYVDRRGTERGRSAEAERAAVSYEGLSDLSKQLSQVVLTSPHTWYKVGTTLRSKERKEQEIWLRQSRMEDPPLCAASCA